VRTDRHVEALLSTTRVAPAVRVEKMMFLVGEIVVSGDNVGKETGNASSSSETKITCFHVLVDEIHGTWRARWPQKGRVDHEGAVSVPHDASPTL
jgi:hypothetical protein